MSKYRVVVTSLFKRDVRARTRRNTALLIVVERLVSALERDPSNAAGRLDVKKLAGVQPGEGQWRIRGGDYRLRYDIIGQDVILYSFRHRKEAY